ncbi:MAG: glutamate synthase large subunit [Spirochaetes bacterium]|jgi:glutamate synthase (NADPH/NADH) large chain|nr:glutamate synthase large subunit [Spirochaetota bacterium]
MIRMYPENQGLYDSTNEHDACGIGLVANIKGKKSHDIIRRGLEVLERMEHRGAEAADNKTGDGAGILIQIPHEFYKREVPGLPEYGSYGTGLVFLPVEDAARKAVKKEFESIIEAEGQKLIAWRTVPVNSDAIGQIATRTEPCIEQVFISANEGQQQQQLEQQLYIIRKLSERTINNKALETKSFFYAPSLSSKTIVYKGMLMPDQVSAYFSDLSDSLCESAAALVHSRFSTNTFPAWDLAQPFRMIAHNGEINTVRGNRFWMSAREALLGNSQFSEDITKLFPIIEPGKSDSASFDNVLEMLVASGRSLPHALMMMVPESWNDKNPISEDLKRFYEYHAAIMEPWDGPASLVFFDGRYLGGTLDRNGLRPSRYAITEDDMIVMGSETGVQTFEPESIKFKGRLMPGKLLLVDIEEGRIIPDSEIKQQIVSQKPYKQWVADNKIDLSDVPDVTAFDDTVSDERLYSLQHQYGYNREELEKLLPALAKDGQEITGSMGTDTPLAVLSDIPQRLFSYFKQVFAQVTNPAIDPIREELVMTLTSFLGSQKNLLEETPEHCRMLKVLNPVLTNRDLAKLREWNNPHFKTATIDATFPASEGEAGLQKAMDRIGRDAEKFITEGYTFLILSDHLFGENNVPIPSLLASAGLHHHLIRQKKRTQCSIIVESAEPREVHHFSLLFGYGADAVNPYGAYAVLQGLIRAGRLGSLNYDTAVYNYCKGISKGILKVLSKMGISTLRSYRGAQVFEAVGLGSELVDTCFTTTPSRLGGIGMEQLATEIIHAHKTAFVERPALLFSEGLYRWRRNGEAHAWNPETIHMLQWATRIGDYDKFKKFTTLVNDYNRKPNVIRGLLDFTKATPVPLDEVESEEEIMKRFTTGAMSFGSISKEAHETIAKALNSIKGRSNSGEGGEDPARFTPDKDGMLARSAIKQVASGRFGVTSHYLANADEIQIKLAQGAKPGEGGQLPGHKVDIKIAATRHSTPGVTLISPPPHHDIYSIEDLAQLIFDLKNANPEARISVKLVSETGVGTIASGVAKAHADNILISGYDGGTGASPQSSIRHAGLPWEIGMAETHQTLVLNDLRGRVRMQTDGQLKTGRDVVIAGMIGAEEFGFGTSALIVLGCTMMRKCHLNTCPFGVATQDPALRKKFPGKPEYLINFFRFLARDVRETMAELGIRHFNDLIGRTDLLQQRSISHWKAGHLDLSALLHRPAEADKYATYCTQDQVHKISSILDRTIMADARYAIEKGEKVQLSYPIANTDRTVGTMLSYTISDKYGESGLPDDTIKAVFTGSAGQSFGAFLARGVTFRLEGDSNDYFGKGLSGGRLIVVPPEGSRFEAHKSIIIGNTVLYGATSGEAYVRGMAGERFCVRNSGALAVVEGTGDHCAEYMTGGRLVVLGQVGRNFGAGMSGGIAYVYDEANNFDFFCNKGMVELTRVGDAEDQQFLLKTIQQHYDHTGSSVAKEILDNWYALLKNFVKVMPLEYMRALNEMKIIEINKKLIGVTEEEELGRTV